MLRRIKSAMLGGKKRKVATVATGLAMLMAATAVAAWIVYQGAGGSAGGKAGTTSVIQALTLTPNFQAGDTLVVPGTPGEVYANVKNDASTSLRLLTLTAGAITSDKPACDTSGLTFTSNPAVVGPSGAVFDGGGAVNTRNRVGTLTAAANLDTDCSGAAFSVALTGTTGP